MGTSILSADQKAALNSAFDDIHQTFARDIFVFKEASHTVISTDANYNPYYNTAGQTTSVINTPVSGQFKARIQYNDDFKKEYWSELKSESQIKLAVVKGTVRLKIDLDAYTFIKDSKRFDIDGGRFVLDSTFRGHGLFDVKYYTLYLKPDV
jgi:flagellar assembly factor FliW